MIYTADSSVIEKQVKLLSVRRCSQNILKYFPFKHAIEAITKIVGTSFNDRQPIHQ